MYLDVTHIPRAVLDGLAGVDVTAGADVTGALGAGRMAGKDGTGVP